MPDQVRYVDIDNADRVNGVDSRPRDRTGKRLGLSQAGMPYSLQTAVVWSSAVESNHDFEGQSLASSPLDERSDVWYGWQESNLRTQPSQSCALFAELQP